MFPISVLAGEVKLHPRTLRIYDQEGILKPQRSVKGRRFYSMNDMDLGRLIYKMTNSGISLAGVKLFLAMTKDLPIELKIDEFEALSTEIGLKQTVCNKGRKLKV